VEKLYEINVHENDESVLSKGGEVRYIAKTTEKEHLFLRDLTIAANIAAEKEERE